MAINLSFYFGNQYIFFFFLHFTPLKSLFFYFVYGNQSPLFILLLGNKYLLFYFKIWQSISLSYFVPWQSLFLFCTLATNISIFFILLLSCQYLLFCTLLTNITNVRFTSFPFFFIKVLSGFPFVRKMLQQIGLLNISNIQLFSFR